MTVKLEWRKIPVKLTELSLPTVLRCGQTFRWRQTNEIWSCTFKGRLVLLRQEPECLYYASLFKSQSDLTSIADDIKCNSNDDTYDLLYDYFNLDVKVEDLYKKWSKVDAHFNKLMQQEHKHKQVQLTGIRILRQDPWENLLSFICSSNNNVKRISQMVNNLCINYGEFIVSYDGINYYDFPTLDNLLKNDLEANLRKLGFGYRAKYILKTAEYIKEHYKNGVEDLKLLREKTYKEAHEELLKFTGVGPKVADCVCLMSLDKFDIVPVDTHVITIAKRDYKIGKSGKTTTLNKIEYAKIRDFFQDLWGKYAGWAHSVLFTADLRDLNNGENNSRDRDQEKEEKEEKVVKKRKREVSIKVEH